MNSNLFNASSVFLIVTHNIPYISSVLSARLGRASSTGGDVRKHILKAGPIRRTVGQPAILSPSIASIASQSVLHTTLPLTLVTVVRVTIVTLTIVREILYREMATHSV